MPYNIFALDSEPPDDIDIDECGAVERGSYSDRSTAIAAARAIAKSEDVFTQINLGDDVRVWTSTCGTVDPEEPEEDEEDEDEDED